MITAKDRRELKRDSLHGFEVALASMRRNSTATWRRAGWPDNCFLSFLACSSIHLIEIGGSPTCVIWSPTPEDLAETDWVRRPEPKREKFTWDQMQMYAQEWQARNDF